MVDSDAALRMIRHLSQLDHDVCCIPPLCLAMPFFLLSYLLSAHHSAIAIMIAQSRLYVHEPDI